MLSRLPKLFWWGLGVLLLGTGPLVLVILFSSDPNPNPIGPGLLAFVTFWPGIVMTALGFAQAMRRRAVPPEPPLLPRK